MDARSPVPLPSGKVAGLLAVLSGSRKVVILPHDNPDPDSLASAAALRFLVAHHLRKSATIGVRGIIGRSENRRLAAALDVPLTPVERVFRDFKGYVVLVDTQPGRANNALPAGLNPVAVIDHHPSWADYSAVPFVDLREDYGATATIVTAYLQEAETSIEARIATGLFYGISSETQHLGREARPADIMACQFLYPYVNKRLLGEIEHPRLSREYFRMVGEAVYNAVLCGDVVVTLLPAAPYPDAVAEAADFLVRLDTAAWALCLGLYEGFLYLSVRARDPHASAGLLLASLLPSGAAGGHGMVAGGRIRVSRRRWKDEACRLAREFVGAVGRSGEEVRPVVGERPRTAGKGRAVREDILDSLSARSERKGAADARAPNRAERG